METGSLKILRSFRPASTDAGIIIGSSVRDHLVKFVCEIRVLYFVSEFQTPDNENCAGYLKRQSQVKAMAPLGIKLRVWPGDVGG